MKEERVEKSNTATNKKGSSQTSIKNILVKVFSSVKDRIVDIAHNIGDVLRFLFGKTGIGFEPGTKLERKLILKRIVVFFAAITAIVLLGVLVIPRIIQYDALSRSPTLDEGERLSFLGSFWGALLASIITLVGSIFTTWLIIQRSYKVDYHRERLENMPVLQMTLNIASTRIINEAKNEDEMDEIADQYPYRDTYKYDPLNFTILIVEIENIGKGIAFKASTPNSCEVYDDITFPAICPNQKVELLISVGDVAEETFVFHFFDMFENYYEQHIGLVFADDELKTYPVVNPPRLVTKTKKIRYVQ